MVDMSGYSSQRTIKEDWAGSQSSRHKAGDEILGRYVVEAELGEGGMGVVYKCFDKVAGVEVAIKGLPPEVVHNRDEFEAVKENFQLVRGLRHPNIAAALTLERDERTQEYYLVMDYAQGQNLNRWMSAHGGEGNRAAQLAVLRQIAVALDYAHNAKPRNIIHRDIKPENILVDDSGQVKILDFGLAAQVRTSLSHVSMQVRSKSGTPAYKSPEQWRGQPQRAPADQYALGVIAYKMLSGDVPFDGDDMDILGRAVLNEPVAPIKGVAPSVNAALAKCLAKRADDRFATCADFVAALSGAHTSPSSQKPSPSRWFAVAAIIVVALAGVGGYAAWQHHKAETARQAEPVRHVAEEKRLAQERAEQEKSEQAAEALAFELSSRAESARRLMDAENDEFKSFFAAEIRAFENACHAGDDAKKNARYNVATNLLTQALSKAIALAEMKTQRQKCQDALTAAERACVAAAAVGADTSAQTAYEGAQAEMALAREACNNRKFLDAITSAEHAEKRFTELRTVVISGELAAARAHKTAERWNECVASAEKILGWEVNNAEAMALKTEASEHLMTGEAPILIGENRLTNAERADGWQLLFNGNDLPSNLWVGVRCGCQKFPSKGWYVENGALTMRPINGITSDGKWFPLSREEQMLGGGGDICTIKKYRNFMFKFDFRLTKAGNSGVRYFFDEYLNKGTCEEYQIVDSAHPDFNRGKDGNRRTAALYDILPAHAEKYLKPIGQWNTGLIVAKGNDVEHWLNGVKVLAYTRCTTEFRDAVSASKYANWGEDKNGRSQRWGELPEGRLLLQDHSDSTVAFRNLKIKELLVAYRSSSDSGASDMKNLGGVQLWKDGPYWADRNVGASKPEEYGYYFWWGDTVGYKRNAANNGWVSVKDGSSFEFYGSNCPTYGKDSSTLRSLGYIDATGNLVATHDAATAHLGAPWRMPTDAEFSALISNCTTTWTTRDDVYGCLVTGKGAYASKSIFLPAAGYGYGSDLYRTGSGGHYWSSTPSSDYSCHAWELNFYSSLFGRDNYRRFGGRSVRPLRGFAQ